MAGTQQIQKKPSLFPPNLFDDPDALSQIAQVEAPPAQSLPDPSVQAGVPMSGVVPASFLDWHADPVNVAKIKTPVTPGTPMPSMVAKAAETAMQAPPIDPAIQGAPQPEASLFGTPAPPAPSWPGLIKAQPGLEDSLMAPATPAAPTGPPSRQEFLGSLPGGHAAILGAPVDYRGKKLAAMGLFAAMDSIGAALTHGEPTVGPGLIRNAQAYQDYQRNLPATQSAADTAAYEDRLKQSGTVGSITRTALENQNLQGGLPLFPQAQKIRDEVTQMWQSGNMAPQDFDNAVKMKLQSLPANLSRFIDPSFVGQVKQLPQTPPKFTVGGSGIEPITYRGQVYGVTPGQNEPPEITQARNMAVASQKQNETSKQDLKAGEFPQVVIARLGKPPLGDPAAMQIYGKKAQDIMAAISSAPRIAMTMARPTQVAEVDADGNPTGKIIYEQAGKAMDSGAMAPGSVSFQAQKAVVKSATSGKIGDQITAFNTAIAHADLLKKAAEALHNGDSRTLSGLSNRLKTEFGDPDVTNFDAIANAYNHEITSVISKGHITDSEVKTGGSTMPSNANFETISKVLDSYKSLASSKMQQLQQQVEKGKKGQANFPDSQSSPVGMLSRTANVRSAPDGASDEVYAADGKTLIGHVVKGKYVPLGK